MTRQGRKNFFFEKKKQKTFVRFLKGDVATTRLKTNKSFRGRAGGPAFFQKGATFINLSGRE